MEEKYDKTTRLDEEGVTLANEGKAESIRVALEELEQARLFYQEINAQPEEAHCLALLGGYSRILADQRKAYDYFAQALRLHQTLEDKAGQAAALCNIGNVYSDLGEKQQALKFYNEALPLYREIGDKSIEAKMLHDIGAIYSDLGKNDQALKYLNEALPLYREIGDKSGESVTLTHIGVVCSDLGDNQPALKLYNESMPLSRAVENKDVEATTLCNLFYILSAANPGFAVFYGKQSVNIYQSLRSNMQELDESVQQAFLKSNEIVYRELANALTNQQRFTEAQQVLDFRQDAPLPFTTLEAGLTAVFNQKLETLAAAIRALDEYKRGIDERQPTDNEAAKLKSFADKQTVANDDYLMFLKTAEREFAAPPTEKDIFPDVPYLK